jgi:7-carboxy-7-deazaguanine synthase
MSAADILWRIENLSPYPILVTLSGGNPAIQPLEPLLEMGHKKGYTFCLETQGSTACPWLDKLDFLTVSPKGPSSGMKTNWLRLDALLHRGIPTVLKVVVFNDDDYLYARSLSERYGYLPMYLQAGNETVGRTFDMAAVLSKLDWLVNKVVADHWNEVTVLPQLHTLLWGNTRGV